jgi:hypothetical protein
VFATVEGDYAPVISFMATNQVLNPPMTAQMTAANHIQPGVSPNRAETQNEDADQRGETNKELFELTEVGGSHFVVFQIKEQDCGAE